MIKKKEKCVFLLKENNGYPACMIYYRLYSGKENYICESKCDVKTRRRERNNPIYDSELVKYLNKNIQHSYNLIILANALLHTRTNNSEAIYLTLARSYLNDQLKSNKLFRFRNGITSCVIQKNYIHRKTSISGIHLWQSFYQWKEKLCSTGITLLGMLILIT